MKITIRGREEIEIVGSREQTLLEILQEAGVYLPALCAGRGTCQKCRVKVLEGQVETGQEENGVCLACKTSPVTDVVLELPREDEREILVEGMERAVSTGDEIEELTLTERNFIAVDIGTTTIAMALVGESSGEIKDTYAALNRQRMYGADVISRIAAANGGQLSLLRQLIAEDLWQGVEKLAKEGSRPVTKVVIAANTTMVHLLMGYDCGSLGRHPFISEHLEMIQTTLGDIRTDIDRRVCQEDILSLLPVIILPGISAFVGGDITADLLVCPGFEEEGISLLLDMGTNGEMVIGNNRRLVAASTAAGPAFEGGNITCGTGSIPGAVNQVRIVNRRAVIGTIGGKQPPVGICGTGIIGGIAELKRNRIMDRGGTLQAPYGDKGFPLWVAPTGEKIALYQQDIRQIQLAKGAIRAGMEQLMEAFGCMPGEVDRVYLAGGFGTGLPIDAAMEIGLLPKEFGGKVTGIGNGALQGAIACGRKPPEAEKHTEAGNNGKNRQLLIPGIPKRLNGIKARVESLSLALAEGFEEKYLRYLDFV
ncbi:MAG: ASKHA domain-containing protein [Lachnospiraceae bacterium]|nr:ASKHA domain-containing protein [Lachnospiraceae bacterium]MDD7050578.1 ASKHA domain-containing protein [Lachnospiraceae bacterium]MDY4097694.1 ASKHA domain-containing protein [Lachnospiraceae bacterium]